MKTSIAIIIGAGNTLLTGLFFAKLWAWFFYPALSMPAIGIWHGYGIGLAAVWPAMLVIVYHETKGQEYLYHSIMSIMATGMMFGFAAAAWWLM